MNVNASSNIEYSKKCPANAFCESFINSKQSSAEVIFQYQRIEHIYNTIGTTFFFQWIYMYEVRLWNSETDAPTVELRKHQIRKTDSSVAWSLPLKWFKVVMNWCEISYETSPNRYLNLSFIKKSTWRWRFKPVHNCPEGVEDDSLRGRPSRSKIDKNIVKISNLIRSDRQFIIRVIFKSLELTKNT